MITETQAQQFIRDYPFISTEILLKTREGRLAMRTALFNHDFKVDE